MMKNRAGLLAIVVLGIATLLMVFVIMPRISDKGKPIGETINEAGNAVKDAVTLGNDTASDILSDAARLTSEATEKVGRLVTGATDNIGGLTGLFANGAIPDDARFAEVRRKAEGSLEELSRIEIPATLDGATSALVDKAQDAGTRTLAFLKGLPAQASAAAPGIARLTAIFSGTDSGAPITTAAPATPVAPAVPAAPAKAVAASVVPTFDVLRVEPDGSTLIAGKAEGGAKLEVISSEKAISVTTVTPGGDFVAIPDQPLASGDYSLSLRATGKDGKQVFSEEIATISVPREKNGQLLAMVTRPGEASRLLSLPGAVVTAEATKTPRTPVATETQPALPAPPAASTDLASQAPVIAPAATTATPSATTTTTVAAVEAAKPEVVGDITISAVEFEGDRIFIAGAASANATLRAFADDIAAGSGSAESNGRFVIEGKADLTPGPHSIRVETHDTAGKTLQHITVPFTRPEAEQAALTAQPQAATANAGTADAAHAPLKQDDNAVIIRRGDTLWQISRRVYGQGVRYTTIYLANQEKINNPDLIEPGQTFTLPKEAVPNAEELHRKRMMGG